jgi:HEAT repeat protein
VARAGHEGDIEAARAGQHDDDEQVRATALGALDRLGALTLGDLEAGLTDPSVLVRTRAAEVAAKRPGVSLEPLLRSDDSALVEVAAWASGEQVKVAPSVLTLLIELATGHRDALVREAAVAALGSVGDVAALPAILAATKDKATVRRRAILALAPFEGPEVDAALERARADRDWQVRQAAEDLLDDG